MIGRVPMSNDLRQFMKLYNDWVEAGAPEHQPFTRSWGICANLEETSESLMDELENVFDNYRAEHPEFSSAFPFGEDLFKKQTYTKSHHLNDERMAFVKANMEIDS